jgi:hypothetical protein
VPITSTSDGHDGLPVIHSIRATVLNRRAAMTIQSRVVKTRRSIIKNITSFEIEKNAGLKQMLLISGYLKLRRLMPEIIN